MGSNDASKPKAKRLRKRIPGVQPIYNQFRHCDEDDFVDTAKAVTARAAEKDRFRTNLRDVPQAYLKAGEHKLVKAPVCTVVHLIMYSKM